MRQRQQADTQRALAEQIRTVFRCTIRLNRSLEEHLERLSESVWSTKQYAALPLYRKEYLRGVNETLFDQLYMVGLTSRRGRQRPMTCPYSKPLV